MKIILMIVFISIFFLACGQSENFYGNQDSTNKEELSIETEKTPENLISQVQKTNSEQNHKDLKDDDNLPDSVYAPDSAVVVQKGSFTVWTNPKDPLPNENYRIFIEVNLTSVDYSFDYSDIEGTVDGTDSYFAIFGGMNSSYNDKSSAKEIIDGVPFDELFNSNGKFHKQILFFKDGKTALYGIDIPGANYLVKDTIKVKWPNNNEEQEIDLVFWNNLL